MIRLALAVFGALWFVAGLAHAEVSVQVLAADPPGDAVVLGRNQNFYLHLHYETDQPVRIWAQPYFQGKQVDAGSNPSNTYSGDGDAIGWFFFMQPGDRVDEIRISAGDGSPRGTQVVAIYPVQISGSDRPVDAQQTDPAWVTQLNARDAAAQRADYEKRMSTPPSSGEVALFGGFMLLMLALGISGFAAPAWGLWRWRGGWRIAAAVPAALMTFVVLRIAIDTTRDPTSHNLWPFEVLIAGAESVGAMIVLAIVRTFRRGERA